MTFNEYWGLLWTIRRDSNVEQYYDELLRPFFKETVRDTKNVKVIPTFDTRYHGKNRSKYECITGSGDEFVWPDYIFVPDDYTHDNPVPPYIKVEFKVPRTSEVKEKTVYYPLYRQSIHNEIKAELSTTPLILTDGITWLFLNEPSDVDKIGNEKDVMEKCFFHKNTKYYNGSFIELAQDACQQFDILKEQISAFVKNSKQYSTTNHDQSGEAPARYDH